jgi:hypothetical protein
MRVRDAFRRRDAKRQSGDWRSQGNPDLATVAAATANAAIEKNDAGHLRHLRGLLQRGGVGDYDTPC